MKLLSVAHECVIETYKDSENRTVEFFQGPSPDEVALVDFSKQ